MIFDDPNWQETYTFWLWTLAALALNGSDMSVVFRHSGLWRSNVDESRSGLWYAAVFQSLQHKKKAKQKAEMNATQCHIGCHMAASATKPPSATRHRWSPWESVHRAISCHQICIESQSESFNSQRFAHTHRQSALWWCTTWCRVTERDVSCIFLHFSETIWNKLKDLYNLIYISNHKHALSCCFQISARLLFCFRVYSRPTAPLFFGGHHATYILGLRGLAHRPIVRWFCCICCIAFSKLQYFTDFHSKSLLHFKIWTAI